MSLSDLDNLPDNSVRVSEQYKPIKKESGKFLVLPPEVHADILDQMPDYDVDGEVFKNGIAGELEDDEEILPDTIKTIEEEFGPEPKTEQERIIRNAKIAHKEDEIKEEFRSPIHGEYE